VLVVREPQPSPQPFGIFGDNDAERSKAAHSVGRRSNCRLDLCRVFEISEIRHAAEHKQQQPGMRHHGKGSCRVGGYQQLQELHAHALTRKLVEAFSRGDAGCQPGGVEMA
jgi:hypothetical protein